MQEESSYISTDRIAHFGKVIEVKAVALDSIKEIKSIDVLQMDIEGAEYDAIIGAQKLIDNSPNLVVVQEWSPFWLKKPEDYIEFFHSRGYKFAKIIPILQNKLEDMVIKIEEINHQDLLKNEQIDIVISKNIYAIINKINGKVA